MQVLKHGCFPACRGTRDALPESPNLLTRTGSMNRPPQALSSLYAAISRAQRAQRANVASNVPTSPNIAHPSDFGVAYAAEP